ncbi:RICIN domain-containing protein [Nocardia abscessus]|uniref:RICIN domain-containing protein n=1 Tax=Nocardia abscessus TaxID=120957 RepID=UPI0018939554|nr:RICIN domain-containing protein [Nocardia abscessus]MBF6339115.1 RICIN domain-containing protein [Nocardia abscessus]
MADLTEGTYRICNMSDTDTAMNVEDDGSVSVKFGGGDQQYWTLTRTANGTFQITNKHTGTQLALPAVERGAHAVCDGHTAMTWEIPGDPDRGTTVGLPGSDMYLGAELGSGPRWVELQVPGAFISSSLMSWRFQRV